MPELADGTTFAGDALAHVSSRTPPTKARWAELQLWAVENGYVLEVRGHSALPGEVTRTRVHALQNAAQVVAALAGPDGMSGLAYDLLEEAADADEAFDDPALGIW